MTIHSSKQGDRVRLYCDVCRMSVTGDGENIVVQWDGKDTLIRMPVSLTGGALCIHMKKYLKGKTN